MSIKKEVWITVLIVLGVSLVSNFVFAENSELWLISGNTFSLDNHYYSVYFDENGDKTRILVKDEDNPNNSSVIYLGDCFEVEYNQICFMYYEYETDFTKRTFMKIRGNISEKAYDIIINNNITTSLKSVYIYDEMEITQTATKNGSLDSFQAMTYIPAEVQILDIQGCVIDNDENGTYINFSVPKDVSDEQKCEFKITSDMPVNFELISAVKSVFGNRTKEIYTTTIPIAFVAPYNYTVVYPSTINTSEQFTLNLTFSNPSPNDIKFQDIAFNIPTDISIDEVTTASDLGNNYNAVHESFSLKKGENETFTYRLKLLYDGNYDILFRPQYLYGKNNVIRYYLENINIQNANITNKTKCSGTDFTFTTTVNESNTYYPGAELDMVLYGTSLVVDPMYNITINVTDGQKLIATKFYDKIEPKGRVLLSRIYSIIPDSSPNRLKYDINYVYLCSVPENKTFLGYTGSSSTFVNLTQFPSIDVKKNMPGIIKKGERVKVNVTVSKNDTFFIKNVGFTEKIPEGFVTRGITKRIMPIGNATDEIVYSYELEYIGTEEKDFSIITTINLTFNDKSKISEIEKLISTTVNNETGLIYSISEPKFYLFEPTVIRLMLNNTSYKKFSNVKVTVANSSRYDLGKGSDYYFIPEILPNQSVYFSTWVVPRETNITLKYIFASDENVSEKFTNYTAKPRRTDIPNPEYIVQYYHYLNGSIDAKVIVNNPSNSNLTAYVLDNKIQVNPQQTYQKTLTVDAEKESFVEYEVFNKTYIALPRGITEKYEERVINNTVAEVEMKPVVEENTTKIILEEPKTYIDWNLIIITVIIILVIILGTTGILYLLKKRIRRLSKNKLMSENVETESNSEIVVDAKPAEIKTEAPNINIETPPSNPDKETPKIENNTNSSTDNNKNNTNNENKDDNINTKNEKPGDVLNKINSTPTKKIEDISASNVVSFSEYEKLKQDLEKARLAHIEDIKKEHQDKNPKKK